jgi:hypothetical protein
MQFLRDGIDRRGIGDTVDRLAQHARRAERRCEARIVAMRDFDARAVERFETAARCVVAHRQQAVVDQILATGGDVVHAEDQRIGSDDVHEIGVLKRWRDQRAVRPPSVSATQSAMKCPALMELSKLECCTPPSRSVKIFSSRFGLFTSCS